MLRNFKLLFFVLALIGLQACKNNEQDVIPVSDFFKTPERVSFKISPDGNYISYLKRSDKQKNDLFIKSLADGTERKATTFDGFFGRDYSWTYDNQIIFNQHNILTNENKMFALDVASLKVRNLLSEKNVDIRVLNRNKQQPDIITIAMNKRDSVYYDIYKLNVKSGELKNYLVNPGKITEWFPDIDGRIRLVKSSDGVDETILFRPNDNAPFTAIIKNNFKNSVKPVPFSCGKNSFYALSNVNRDKTALVEINALTGKEQRVIFSSDKADILRVDYSRNKGRLDLASWEEAKPQKHFLNSYTEAIYKSLQKQLGDNEINIAERDTAENKFIINTYTDRNQGSVYLYELNKNKITNLADNSAIAPDKLCAVHPVSFKASDGWVINGYLTLPKGGSTNLPVVVMPHDGPFAQPGRDSWRYSAEIQFLANRGYAVFQVNYRGSIGYGKAFYSAGFKELGGKIQQDITDGVNWLIDKKIANPHKIAIFGRGFGGFSALYGVSFHPKLYKCAITQYGIINILAYIKDVNPFFKPSLQMMYEMIGNPETDASKLIAISPVFHPEKIKVPLLIFQGRKDPRANISELDHFVAELQKRNKVPVKYVLQKNERQAFRNERARMEMYTEIEEFLDTNLRGKN
ncbi:MAG: prolyl oligopeptidase family serine peptidase [Mucilaginibacter sp.]